MTERMFRVVTVLWFGLWGTVIVLGIATGRWPLALMCP